MTNKIFNLVLISFIALLSGCGQNFEKKYSENCSKLNIQTTSLCQCMGNTLDKTLTSEQKDIILNGANGNLNLNNISAAIGVTKPILEATNSCSKQENAANFAKLSPEDQCKAAKLQALKSSEPYFMALMNGERGLSVRGYQEAISATKMASSICKIDNYGVNELLGEAQLTSSGFVLKENSKAGTTAKNEDEFNYEINSDSMEFSGAKLNGKVKDYKHGDPLEIDGGPYYFTKNRALLSYEYDEKVPYEKQGLNQKINSITYNCTDLVFGRSKGIGSIDGISCESTLPNLDKSNWKKLCYVYSFESLNQPFDFLYLKNNAFVIFRYDKKTKSHLIEELGIISDPHKFNYAYKECDEADKLRKATIQKGYNSLGAMMSEKK